MFESDINVYFFLIPQITRRLLLIDLPMCTCP